MNVYHVEVDDGTADEPETFIVEAEGTLEAAKKFVKDSPLTLFVQRNIDMIRIYNYFDGNLRRVTVFGYFPQ